ncbi:Membrane-bound lysozyme-inhibitor of c-type lysozyme [Marinobacter sp. es.048]|uniref:META domain-containing protein n=1 Tax=Marinobacter sp. es.048 TaxID=1761795 RepID=UPI000B63E7CF|nr:META domain-containing protein [Marinobacter sp. es.048]SNC63617.1 Membrane-bound lysozyme-inhibitor of c-type lysozyme [Marinobacter sp. es.048]
MHPGRVLLLSVVAAAGLTASACTSLPESSQPVSASYACGQLDIAVSGTQDGDLISIDYLDRRILLKPEVSASGALYVAPGDDQTRFWSKGEKATLTVNGQTYPECLQPGDLEMPFEARGNEPFWHATIEGGELLLTRPFEEQGTRRVPVELKAANRHGRTFVATLDDLPITLTVARQLCEDSMSGAQYPAQVRLEVGRDEYRGCGGDRQRLFRGAIWVVEDLAGAGIIDRSRITIEFLEGNRIAGRASCNRYTGAYELRGEGMAIGPLASTRMACAPALMNQEERFLNLLDQVNSVRIGQQGQLLLSTPGGESIRAFQSDHDSP